MIDLIAMGGVPAGMFQSCEMRNRLLIFKCFWRFWALGAAEGAQAAPEFGANGCRFAQMPVSSAG
ncbi:hypothetical protein PCAR4_40208 [Paraburkholderia caribensis]|nr:hypothetical protein PCAR4_40208 [Paraburkholderia caribensis]